MSTNSRIHTYIYISADLWNRYTSAEYVCRSADGSAEDLSGGQSDLCGPERHSQTPLVAGSAAYRCDALPDGSPSHSEGR